MVTRIRIGSFEANTWCSFSNKVTALITNQFHSDKDSIQTDIIIHKSYAHTDK